MIRTLFASLVVVALLSTAADACLVGGLLGRAATRRQARIHARQQYRQALSLSQSASAACAPAAAAAACQ